MPTVGSLLIKLGLNSAAFTSGLDRSTKRLTALGSDLKGLGTKMSVGITLPLVALGTAAIKTANDFESGFAGVKKTVDATEAEFADLREGLIEMTKEIPASADTIFQVAEAAGQLGVETQNIEAFTRTMVDLGNTTNISAEDGAQALARLANITGTSQTQFSNLGSGLVDLGNNLATTESEILEMSLRLAAAGKTAGLSVADITGFAGALTSVGIKAEAGGTAFGKVFIRIKKAVETGSGDLDALAQVAGQTAQEFAQAYEQDPARAIQSFVEGLGRIEEEGGSLFQTLDQLKIKEVRLRNALLATANAGDIVEKSLDIANKGFNQNTALVEEAEKRYETTQSQIDVFGNQVKALGAQVGDILVPALQKLLQLATPIVEWVATVVKAFSELDPGVQAVIGVFVTGFAAGGPILVALGLFMTALATVTAPMLVTGAIVLGIIAGITAIVAYWDEIKKIPQIVEQMIKDVEKWFVGKLTAIFDTVNEKIDSVVGGFKSMYDFVVGNSIVPDMVDDIGKEFNRFDRAMVQPTILGTTHVTEAFQGMSTLVAREVNSMNASFSRSGQKIEQFGEVVRTSFGLGGPSTRGLGGGFAFDKMTPSMDATKKGMDRLFSSLEKLVGKFNEFSMSLHEYQAASSDMELELAWEALLKALEAVDTQFFLTTRSAETMGLITEDLLFSMGGVTAELKGGFDAGAVSLDDYATLLQQLIARFLQMAQVSRAGVGRFTAFQGEATASLGRFIETQEHLNQTVGPKFRQETEESKGVWDLFTDSFRTNTELMADSIILTFGSIRTAFTNTIVGMVTGANTFKDVLNSLWQSIFAGFLNMIFNMALQWFLTQTAMTEASAKTRAAQEAMNAASTASTAATETARLGIILTTNKLMLGAAATTVAAMSAMGLAAVGMMEAVVLAIAGIFSAIAAALAASVYGSICAANFAAAAAVISGSGSAAAVAAGSAVLAASKAALVTIGALAAPIPLAQGGVVTRPTLAMIGEGPGPEAVIPLDRLHGVGGGREQTIILQLDGKEVARRVVPQIPKLVRMKLGAAM
jgi:TP901 family phage tail tape measure protein